MSRHLVYYVLMAGSLLLTSCLNGRTTPSAVSTTDSTSTIKIGGSAETYEVLEHLIEAYQTETVDSSFEFLPPSQTSGGIGGVKSGVIDIGGVSRIPKPDEIDDQITHLRLVKTPLVVVVHDSVTGISNITDQQIKAIYSGQITNWKELGGPDANIVLLDFTEDENEKQVLRQTYLGQDLAITPKAIVFPEDDELAETAATTQFSMATMAYEEEHKDLALIPLSVNGVTPSAKTVQSGEYPMALSLGVIFNSQSSSATQAFLEFATSPRGQKTLSDTNYIPLNVN